MGAPRLQITEGMRRFLDYPKFAGTTRVLVLDTGYFFDQSWLRAAAQLGWETASVRSVITGDLTRDDIASLFQTIGDFKPDFILTSNYAGMDNAGIFANFFNDAKLPYVSWFTDTPRMILFNRTMYVSDYAVAATWERAYEPHLRRLGFEHVHYMPLATDPDVFRGVTRETFERELAFVGNSMLVQLGEALEKHVEVPHVTRAVEEAIREGRATRAAYAEGIADIIGLDLYDSLDETGQRNAELLLNYEVTSHERIELARTLAPLGLEVRGDATWAKVIEKHGPGVHYFDQLSDFYNSTAINVNQTSLQMRDAVNQRVFDCPAAGGFVLTDNQPDLHDHFDVAREMVTYESLAELSDKARYYLQHREERQAIATRARARVLAEHTHAHRLRALEAYMKPLFGVQS
jgi:spore maturation protein CgeB